jgi:putative endonuclease
MSYYVYILLSQRNGKYYIGSTNNLEERLRRHNEGRSNYTKPGIPWELQYCEEYPDRSSAVKRENYLKRQKSKKIIESLVRTSRWLLREGRPAHIAQRDLRRASPPLRLCHNPSRSLRTTKGSAAIPLISTRYEIASSPGAPRNDITTQSLWAGSKDEFLVVPATNKIKDLKHFLSPFFMPYFSSPHHYPHHQNVIS